ncbi:hypothetical protein MVEN_01319100 [Mycena venus]|uniref:FAD/NAD(P)-binding domain-containing protein n=1 Tax=Mycena venus TaxID=2733690 RepID=A0A8H6Y1A6_9AGAR|nr:hypothetical protein MVEN_01319100 [Mycena venus]
MPDTENIPRVLPKRILVIGGGASGLVTLRNLLERGEFDEVQLIERRDDVGGVCPKVHVGLPLHILGSLETSFLNFCPSPPFRPFQSPPSTATGQPFPTLAETHTYLQAFAAPLLSQGLIRLNTEVCAMEELKGRAGWRVRLRRWAGGGKADETEETWDAVVVAVACYDYPVFPTTPGIAQLRDLGLAQHAQIWRGPGGYDGKRLLVIGNANSGNDIAAQLAPVAGAVFQSIRRPNFPGFPSLPDPRIARVASVEEYVVRKLAESTVVDAHLTDGTVIHDLDGVLFGTGYLPFPDFVRVLDEESQTLVPLVTATTSPPRVPSLHRYTLYARNPTLAFVGTAVASYTPFTIADVCSTWLALAWTGTIEYPTTLDDLLEFERERLAAVAAARIENGSGIQGILEAYASGLRAEVVQARPELGAVLPVWNPERTEVREAMFDKKRAALELARVREREALGQ